MILWMENQTFWQKPRLHEDANTHRKVSWLELFFDLVFVVVISELVHLLSQDLSFTTIGNYVFLFMPAWWVWIGATYYNDRFETEGLESRVFTFLLMIPVAGLAIFAHHVPSDAAWGYGMSYLLARACIMWLWARASIHEKRFRPVGNLLMTGYSLGIILFLWGLFQEDVTRIVLWSLALLCDLCTPLCTLKRQSKLPLFNLSKLPERLGLFVLIVLGETLVGVIRGVARHHHLHFRVFSEGILGVAISFALWWIYFDYIARRVPKADHKSTFLWSYLHLVVVMSIGAVGASLLHVLTSKHHIPSDPARVLLTSALAMTLLFIGLIEMILKRDENEPTKLKVSTSLKFASAFLLIVLGLFGHELHAFMLLAGTLLVMLPPLGYGLVVWFQAKPKELA